MAHFHRNKNYKGCKQNGGIKEVRLYDSNKIFKSIKQENLLSETELDILHSLNESKNDDLYATLIAQELDCSYQLIGQRAAKLQEKQLITKSNKVIENNSRKVYKITQKAEEIYFKK